MYNKILYSFPRSEKAALKYRYSSIWFVFIIPQILITRWLLRITCSHIRDVHWKVFRCWTLPPLEILTSLEKIIFKIIFNFLIVPVDAAAGSSCADRNRSAAASSVDVFGRRQVIAFPAAVSSSLSKTDARNGGVTHSADTCSSDSGRPRSSSWRPLPVVPRPRGRDRLRHVTLHRIHSVSHATDNGARGLYKSRV